MLAADGGHTHQGTPAMPHRPQGHGPTATGPPRMRTLQRGWVQPGSTTTHPEMPKLFPELYNKTFRRSHANPIP